MHRHARPPPREGAPPCKIYEYRLPLPAHPPGPPFTVLHGIHIRQVYVHREGSTPPCAGRACAALGLSPWPRPPRLSHPPLLWQPPARPSLYDTSRPRIHTGQLTGREGHVCIDRVSVRMRQLARATHLRGQSRRRRRRSGCTGEWPPLRPFAGACPPAPLPSRPAPLPAAALCADGPSL